MSDTLIPEHGCPYCGYKLEATSGAFGDYEPREGAMSICFNCTKVSIFDKDLKTRLPNEEEEFIIRTFPAIKRAQEAIMRTKEQMKKKKEAESPGNPAS